MNDGWFADLDDRGVVSVGGLDAGSFLAGLVTSRLPADAGRAAYGALLTPQGKILCDFLIFAVAGGFLLDVRRNQTAALVRRLGLYRLRADVDIQDVSSERRVVAFWDGEEGPPGSVADPRVAEMGFRGTFATGSLVLSGGYRPSTLAAYHTYRITLGVPEGGMDFAFGAAFPHDADLDQIGGVDFTKGCFIGQEVVSRMQHRGTARRRIVLAEADGPLTAGAEITAGGQAIGTVGSVGVGRAIAMVRLDRAREAERAGIPLVVGETPVTLQIPAWARFGWPETIEEV